MSGHSAALNTLAPQLLASSAGGVGKEMGLGAELEFLAVGLAIVMGTLCLLWLLTALVGRLFVWYESSRSLRRDSVPVAPVVRVEKVADEVPIAVIAAAVAVALESPHRIISVESHRQDWVMEGRRRIFASHQLR